MKNWLMFLLYLPWYNPFVILLQKMVVEFARSGIGLALEEMLVSFFFSFFPFRFSGIVVRFSILFSHGNSPKGPNTSELEGCPQNALCMRQKVPVIYKSSNFEFSLPYDELHIFVIIVLCHAV